MALTRYRHFWTSRLIGAGIPERQVTRATTNDQGETVQSVVTAEALVNNADLSGILKNYTPPRFLRALREVEVGKYMNERILGRLSAPDMNFSIVIPSDYERLYGYNVDYSLEVVEELHNNTGASLRFVTDEITGTLFDRQSGMYNRAQQDRDWTLIFITKTFKRIFSDDADGNVNAIVVIDVNVQNGTFNQYGPVTTEGTRLRNMMDTNLVIGAA